MQPPRDKTISPAFKWVLTCALLLFAATLPVSAQLFTNVNASFSTNQGGYYMSSAVAADFNADGKMDFLIEGFAGGGDDPVWINAGNDTYNDAMDLNGDGRGAYAGTAAGADFANTGQIDALVTGSVPNSHGAAPGTQLWHNVGGGNFLLVTNAELPGISSGFVAVADFDNDGKLDIMLWGTGALQISKNLGNGMFTNMNAGIRALGSPYAVLGVFGADFDNDGYVDVLIGAKMWKNMGNGSFTNIPSGLPGGAIAIGDFDNDGFLDVLVANGSYQIWRNLGNGTFTNSNIVLPILPSAIGVYPAVAAVGDYDNDGRLDIILTAGTNNSPTMQVWRNLGNGQFSNTLSTTSATEGSLTWGDFNNDSRLDFLVTGQQGTDNQGNPINRTQVWRNNSGCPSNAPPTAPTNLTTQVKGHGGVQLNWGAATDDHTPTAGLNYNIRVSSVSGGVDIVSPEANPLTGQRLVVQIGNAQERLFSLLTNLTGGTYYWSVQAIDTAFAGGVFASESTFVIPPTINGFIYTNGQFQVAFNALATNSYTLQASTNLSAWVAVANVVPATNGLTVLTDTNIAIYPQRYYRVGCP